MRISILQTDIVWENKQENLRRLREKLETLRGTTEIVVLPEMFSTGFSMQSKTLAEPNSGETITTLKLWARQFQIAICGSYIATDNGLFYNRAFVLTPEGEEFYYDKRHLFRMGREAEHFSAGTKRLILPYLEWNICLQVCYDLRFPVWSRNINNEYDLLIYVANCPIATFDINYSHPNLINVISDDEKGLYLSTKYMINHGHTEIAFVADYEGNIVLTKRFNGYKKALEDSHIPFRPEYIFSYPPSYEGGIEAGRAIAGSKSPITAVVTTADICAIGIMEGARLGGYRVPIDLSVIGYDNLNLCQYTVPKLTSVSQNVPKKARLATELLLKKIHDNESDSNFGEIMDVEIVDRQSVISLY